jgi:nitrilase
MADRVLRVAIAQVAPAWLQREATLDKVLDNVSRAADESAELVAFGEALVPGYPFWPGLTDGARFDSAVQKDLYAHYAEQAVDIAGGGLERLCTLAAQRRISVYLGCIERATERSAHSLYASLVYVDASGAIGSVHRKLCPTHEERLVWSPGDGHGLRVHGLGGFRVGGLNCWENWMPLPRAALYAQGENLHVAAWPGSLHNTDDITRFMAREGRSYVLSVSGLMHRDWIPRELPHAADISAAAPEWMANGGSCIAGPDGQWVLEPRTETEFLACAELELHRVYRERQNFDPAGHYSRPDVTRLEVDRRRQATVSFED